MLCKGITFSYEYKVIFAFFTLLCQSGMFRCQKYLLREGLKNGIVPNFGQKTPFLPLVVRP